MLQLLPSFGEIVIKKFEKKLHIMLVGFDCILLVFFSKNLVVSYKFLSLFMVAVLLN